MTERVIKVDQIAEFDQLREVYLDSVVDDLKNKIEKKDEMIRNSSWRKAKGYICNGKVKRTIWTSEGSLTYERTKFKRKVGKHWKTTFLVDDYFQIEKYSKLSYEFKAKIIAKVAQNYKYEQIISDFHRLKIDKSTISRLIKKNDFVDFNHQDLSNYQIPKNSAKFDTIYISTDDSFLSLKEKARFERYAKGQKYRVRLAILYQGISKTPDSRNSKLINKRIVYKLEKIGNISRNNVVSFSHTISKAIVDFYGERNWKLVVSGDGDNYIKGIADELGAEIVLDWFHLKMKLKKCFHFTKYRKREKSDVNVFETIAKVLKTSPNLAINNYLKPLSDSDFLKKDETKELIIYIKKNIKGIQAYQKDWYIGCVTESNVYHFVKSISNGKSYSVKTFSNLLALRVGWINTLKPIEVWHRKVEEKIDQDLQFKRYPKIKVEEDRIKHGSLTSLSSGKNYGWTSTLKKM